ncbi:hypothetical protein EVAR_7785_1 [Eumeta japonica]|uniref:Uncharacterized protein n=1 Tax=Eumeta variegata TaxID=151549 RepID=A0A4C1TMF5_EUMVA|nr:hypothetical protein EVAR_7785_1 [Eumeta japonica]
MLSLRMHPDAFSMATWVAHQGIKLTKLRAGRSHLRAVRTHTVSLLRRFSLDLTAPQSDVRSVACTIAEREIGVRFGIRSARVVTVLYPENIIRIRRGWVSRRRRRRCAPANSPGTEPVTLVVVSATTLQPTDGLALEL